jgi:CDP-paratose 2-epimerase
MRILITGICGFAGSTLARKLLEEREGLRICGIDNLSRAGSETNLASLRALGCEVTIADIRDPAVFEAQPACDWLIDAAANPSVLAGTEGYSPAKELLEVNLFSTVPMLEYCRKHRAVFTLLSTSRVYGINALRAIPMTVNSDAYQPDPASPWSAGVPESFSTAPPVSLYGASKLCAETLALEYGSAFDFPVWINRCGVLAGAGQFGKADQGIFSFWIHRWAARAPLKYIGFGGKGWQVRDCLHPGDLAPLLLKQFDAGLPKDRVQTLNLSGGTQSATSLRQLSNWCAERMGPHLPAESPEDRAFDLPWVVLDPSLAQSVWGWQPRTPATAIFEEIATHALSHPGWLQLCGA